MAISAPSATAPPRALTATRVPLVGRVSMDLTTFDVTDQPGLQPGDSLD